jgi:hypothetical protein
MNQSEESNIWRGNNQLLEQKKGLTSLQYCVVKELLQKPYYDIVTRI